MDVSCPSLPPKILVADKVRPNVQTTAFMAAHGCHFVECFWYVLLVIIESFFLAVRDCGVARTLLYKVSIAIVSRTLREKQLRTPVRDGFDNYVDRIVACNREWRRTLFGSSQLGIQLYALPTSSVPARSLG